MAWTTVPNTRIPTGGGPALPTGNPEANTRSSSSAQQSNGSQIPPRRAASGPITWSYTLIFLALNVPQVAPAFIVPAGCTVRVRAHNGQTAGNLDVAQVGTDYSIVRRGQGIPLAPLDDVAIPVDNIGRLWAAGRVGDGVVITVVSQ